MSTKEKKAIDFDKEIIDAAVMQLDQRQDAIDYDVKEYTVGFWFSSLIAGTSSFLSISAISFGRGHDNQNSSSPFCSGFPYRIFSQQRSVANMKVALKSLMARSELEP